jgi:effector-binding domain-containing protein
MLKGIGLSLDDINGLLHNGMPVEYIRQLLRVKKSEIQERMSQDRRRLRQVEIWLEKIDKEGLMPTDICIQRKRVPALRVISIREIGTYEETIIRLIEELRQKISQPENQETAKVSGPVMALFYDDEYKEKDADIEVALPISGKMSPEEAYIQVKTLPEGEVISAIYKGHYDGLDRAYTQIFEYAEEHDLKLLTPLREIYHKYIGEAPEDELLTEIQLPFEEPLPYLEKNGERQNAG